MDHEPIFKSKNGNLFKKEDVVDYYYESEVPDQPFQPSAKQDQLIAEKVVSPITVILNILLINNLKLAGICKSTHVIGEFFSNSIYKSRVN
jgi:hypothetical protein